MTPVRPFRLPPAVRNATINGVEIKGSGRFVVADYITGANGVNGAPKGYTPAVSPDPSGVLEIPDELAPGDTMRMLVSVPAARMSAAPDAGVGETVAALPVETVPGLWYRASWGGSLFDRTEGEKVQAEGDTLFLGVVRQDGAQGFYGLTVSED